MYREIEYTFHSPEQDPLKLKGSRPRLLSIMSDYNFALLGMGPFTLYELSLHLLFNFSISLHTASVTPAVPSFPPKSLVKIPASHTLSTHRIIMSAASSSPTHRNISAADQKTATGFATPLPIMSNALPCTGSNILGALRSGSRFAPRRHADTARQCRSQITQDVHVQVRADDGVD